MTTTATTEHQAIDHATAMVLAHTAYSRFADVVEEITPEQWTLPTDCDGWTVRDLVGHMVGAMRSAASNREMGSQLIEIRRRMRQSGENITDTMTQVQIDRAAALTVEQLPAACRGLVDRATKGRRRTPALLRRVVRIPVDMGTIAETWRLGYLIDVILTRDAWLHRIDLCRAIGGEPVLTADHDGRIVADIAAEWGRRHGQPYDLTLAGAAGGTFSSSGFTDAEPIELDAVEFCRILSGRARGDGLLATAVPF